MTNETREQHEQSGRGTTTRPEPNRTNGRGVLAARQNHDEARVARPADEQPDVLLDVPVVKVDEINLEVEDLRARVSLQAEVLDLLRLNVGADVLLGRVHLDIKGVEAQAMLKVRLDNVAQIIERVLTTIDNNPQILEQITKGAGAALEDVGGGARQAVGEVGRGAGTAVQDVGRGAGGAVEDVGGGARKAVEDVGGGVGGGAREAVGETGKAAGKAVSETGEAAGETAGAAVKGVGGLNPGRLAAGAARTGMRAGRDGLRWLKDQTERLAGDGDSSARE